VNTTTSYILDNFYKHSLAYGLILIPTWMTSPPSNSISIFISYGYSMLSLQWIKVSSKSKINVLLCSLFLLFRNTSYSTMISSNYLQYTNDCQVWIKWSRHILSYILYVLSISRLVLISKVLFNLPQVVVITTFFNYFPIKKFDFLLILLALKHFSSLLLIMHHDMFILLFLFLVLTIFNGKQQLLCYFFSLLAI